MPNRIPRRRLPVSMLAIAVVAIPCSEVTVQDHPPFGAADDIAMSHAERGGVGAGDQPATASGAGP